jgi:hypothetical protein
VPFRADLPAGAACRIDAGRLHPTQFSVGRREIAHKRKAIDKMSAAELPAYLRGKDVPVVIGPDGGADFAFEVGAIAAHWFRQS